MKQMSAIFSAAKLTVTLAAAGTVGTGHEGPGTPRKKTVDPNRVAITLKLVLTGLERPVAVRAAGDGSGRLFIVEQPGRIQIIDGDGLRSIPFLDIANRVRGDIANEQGLLGLAFHPEYAGNGRFFVNYTDLSGDTVIAEYTRSESDTNLSNPSSEAIIMTIQQPYSNHNGGDLAFGPDGFLWIATGDGGNGGDPQGNGQNPETLLGKLLRVDVDNGSTYTIPPDNPFVDDRQAMDEIWAIPHISPASYCGQRCTVPSGVFSPRGARRTASTRSAPLGSNTPLGTAPRRPRDETW